MLHGYVNGCVGCIFFWLWQGGGIRQLRFVVADIRLKRFWDMEKRGTGFDTQGEAIEAKKIFFVHVDIMLMGRVMCHVCM